MTNSYIIDERTKKIRIFKDEEPPAFKLSASPLHKHEYAEVHIVGTGHSICTVENVDYELLEGDALLVPPAAYHMVHSDDLTRRHFSFQAELSCTRPVKMHFPKEFIKELFERLSSGDHSIGTLSYICRELSGISCYRREAINDYKHAIGNFFDKRHHENVEIEDLANTLHLSKMQTQRLVKKHTGMTFGENLRTYRLRVAEYLMKNSDMTKEEIARSVGYSSYSGFWKAQKKQSK